ncbi:MAG: hypothetical protein ACFFCS_14450 [Candidatus Hodarchaeota archaeon]
MKFKQPWYKYTLLLCLVSSTFVVFMASGIKEDSKENCSDYYQISPSDGLPPSINTPADFSVSRNQANVVIPWTITDPDDSGGPYVVLVNGTIITSTFPPPMWSDGVSLNFPVDTSQPGLYNYSIGFADGLTNTSNFGGDEVFVRVDDPPTIDTPSVLRVYLNTPNATFNITIIDTDSSNGTLNVYNNSILFSSANWTNNTVVPISIDTSQVGSYNFTVNATDGVSNVSRNTTIWINSTFPPEISEIRNQTISPLLGNLLINFTISDMENTTGNYTVLREGAPFNSSFTGSGMIWIENITYSINLSTNVSGRHNFTVIADDLDANSISQDFFIYINYLPTTNLPTNASFYNTSMDPIIVLTITDLDNSSGRFTVYKEGVPLAFYTNIGWINGTPIEIYDPKIVGDDFNYTIIFHDGISTLEETVLITILADREPKFDDITLTIILGSFIFVGVIGAILLLVKKSN